jgi:hypothetical protein
MKNKNNSTFQEVDVLVLLPHVCSGVVVPCKFVRNYGINQKIIPLYISPFGEQERGRQAKNTRCQVSLVCSFSGFRKNEKIMIALKGSIFSPVYFFYFVSFKS